MASVRTRIAPSPTGDPHVGTAYVALFNRAFTRSQAGELVLRIEDTDRVRSSASSERAIIRALRWLGLDWDEGPDVGGRYGPYRQSERQSIYREHADRLLAAGHAFHCFCTPERLTEVRRAQQRTGENPRYDGHCLDLDPADVKRRIAAGEAHVVRMKVPETGVCVFEDTLRGAIEIPWSQIDMQVLMKADGFPTYHLGVVVDDELMKISHVMRGEEWINSVPKHLKLYEYFGWQPPQYYHLPLLRNPDKSKLSKRRNPTSINYYRAAGYLPEAMLNYLSTMGWSMPDGREIFNQDDMIHAFTPERISLGAPVFDLDKLNWLNGQYIRAMSDDELVDRVADWAVNRDRLEALVPMVKERTERFLDLVPQVDYLLGERRAVTPADFEIKGLDQDDVIRILQFTMWRFEALTDWDADAVQAICRETAEKLDLKIRDYLAPLFVAVSGRSVSLPLFDSMAFIGSALTRMRLRSALAALGGVSKKQVKRLEKEYRELFAGVDEDVD